MRDLPGPYLVYLLCFDRPIGGVLHYVGITTPGRVHQRCLEHLHGHGAKLTAQAHAQGVGFYLGRYWTTDRRDLEAKIQEHKNLARLCDRCARRLPIIHYRAKTDAQPPVRDWAPTEF